MTDLVSDPSRRALLGALTAAPLIARAAPGVAVPRTTLGPINPDPIVRRCTSESLSLSHNRFESAHQFFPERHPLSGGDWHRFLYAAGITAQLGLLSYLMAIGFDDDWCARRIGYRPTFALDYANRYGFCYDRPDMARLADVLSPYWQWNGMLHVPAAPLPDVGFTPSDVCALLRDMLHHVGRMTGHHSPDRRRTA